MQKPQIYCPFCDRENPTHRILAQGTNVVLIENLAPRQPVSNVLFDPAPKGGHYGSIMKMPELAWVELLFLHARYVEDNPDLFRLGGELTWRLVFNHTATGATSPAGRQSVFHAHAQQFGPGREGLNLGRFCTVQGYPQGEASAAEILPASKEARNDGWHNGWSFTRRIPTTVPPADFLFLPPKGYPSILEGDPQVLVNLHVALRGCIAVNSRAFRDGGRLVFNAGKGALQLSVGCPFEVRLVGGTGLDLGSYTEYVGAPTLPDPALMVEGDRMLEARAAELGQEYIGSWWKHTTCGAKAAT